MENYENIRLPWPDWRIVRYIGGGAYGKVYEIERNVSGIKEKAALKIISRPKDYAEMEAYYDNGYDQASMTASYENEIRTYVKEYQMMRELQGQSNIVSCDDFTVVPHKNGIGGDIFIRMELLTSLQQVLRERTLSEKEIIKLGKDISRALMLCESQNIIHRDIKPANIMISKFGDYKLGDFGVSKVMDHTTFATAMGTPEYQAPEVVHMEKYGQTADIYSLGVTLYWLLNNRKMPFIGADERLTPMAQSEASRKRYRGDKLPAPKNGSAKFKQIVLKACEYRPENRYASAREMYEALDALQNTRTSVNVSEAYKSTVSESRENSYYSGSISSDTVTKGGVSASEYEQDESNSWGESFGTIGIAGQQARAYTTGDSNKKSGETLFKEETVGTIGIKNAAEKKNVAEKKNEYSFSNVNEFKECKIGKATDTTGFFIFGFFLPLPQVALVRTDYMDMLNSKGVHVGGLSTLTATLLVCSVAMLLGALMCRFGETKRSNGIFLICMNIVGALSSLYSVYIRIVLGVTELQILDVLSGIVIAFMALGSSKFIADWLKENR